MGTSNRLAKSLTVTAWSSLWKKRRDQRSLVESKEVDSPGSLEGSTTTRSFLWIFLVATPFRRWTKILVTTNPDKTNIPKMGLNKAP